MAIATGAKLAEVWAGHPNFWTVAACPRVEEKVERVLEIIAALVGSR
ncbi:MAG TPA: hypothetical protein VIM11_20345 [Tepidisphaeraceae bacterium]|jgi:hypothetical protein